MNEKKKKHVKVGVVGAAGLSGGKLIDILADHPAVELVTCVSESSPGEPLWKTHPQLRARLDMRFDVYDIEKLGECDIVFSCRKAGESFSYIEELLAAGVRVIDLSGDYRLKSVEVFQKWYDLPHPFPGLLEQAVYGLPEYYREKIREAALVANPGCYTTTSILACAPLVAAGLGTGSPIIIDAISGVSGAGRAAKLETQFISVSGNVRAYRVGTHQHTPEIEQELSEAARRGSAGKGGSGAEPVRLLFVPHVGPYSVGIMANCYLRADGKQNIDDQYLFHLLLETYKREPFVRVYEPGGLPQIEYAAGTNFCDIGAKYDPRTGTIVVISVTDNLIKGAAGQAVQNMNIMFGIDETAGLM